MRHLNIREIQEILPHRHPFLLLDYIEDYEPGQYAIGYKCVSYREEFFAGHFPGEPIVIYPDILDQLLPETESEAPAVESDQESSDSLNTETAPPDTEMPPYETESDTNSLQDLMNRLGA